METRKSKIEKLIKLEVKYYSMYSEGGMMYFRNEQQISEAEFLMADRSGSKKEMPLFYDADVKKKFNLKTFKDANS
ncbi:hypothetical protein [Chryseobacterium sp.]|uniref:hypothetical protein n=1 Tax=Chryseobacterium sp. TaxID=1871047 RepID=UPI0011C95A81|nr:hypothetical protein [Chryseobacterium sp.]TXF75927.1 hypothetical protein FUA25_08460 [Chryseobacterium sp.]